jgi:hypothetical protein
MPAPRRNPVTDCNELAFTLADKGKSGLAMVEDELTVMLLNAAPIKPYNNVVGVALTPKRKSIPIS